MIESLAEEVKNLSGDIHVEEIDGEVRVSGKTYPVRDRLKVLGFQWESESKEWYYLDPLGKKALAFNHPLPVSFANDVDTYLAISAECYENIAIELGTSARIASLLGNLGILFACGDIAVRPELTEALKPFADVVPAKEANLDGYGSNTVYKLKPEFEKYFEGTPSTME